MKTTLFFLNLVKLFLVAALFTVAAEVISPEPVSFFVVFGVVFCLSVLMSFVPGVPGVMNAEVVTKLFAKDAVPLLFPNNMFYSGAVKDEGIAHDATTVQIGEEDFEPGIEVDPSSFPLTIEEQVDTSYEYGVNRFATRPTRLDYVDELVSSFNKRESILRRHTRKIKTRIANTILYKWGLGAGNIVRTSGSDRLATSPSATGNRKALVKANLLQALEIMGFDDVDDYTDAGLKLVIPPSMYTDLMNIDEFVLLQNIGDPKLKTGKIGEILGIEVFKRSRANVFDNTATPVIKAVGAAAAATDNHGALLFHDAMVRYAEGTPKFYINPDRGEYLGTTMNMEVRSGGTTVFSDGKGVVNIVEAAGS